MDELDAHTTPLISFSVSSDGGGSVVVRIAGELDISSIDALEERIGPMLTGPPARLVVDVSELRFADSSAIALWVRWAARVPEFELRDPSPLLQRVVTAMGLAEKLAVRS